MASNFFNFHLHHNHNHINLMNVDEKRYKYGNLLIFACFFLYMSSMAAKGVFSAQSKFFVDLWQLQYSTVSMANTYYFVAYGLVQIALFFIMSKLNLVKYTIITVPISAITTALIGLSTQIEHVWIYFGLSGAFQAGIYCACNQVLTRYLPLRLLSRGNTIMNLGYAVGTVVAYTLSALFIGLGGEGWRVPYFMMGGFMGVATICFATIVYVSKRFARVNGMLDKKLIAVKTKKKVNMDDVKDPFIDIKTRRKEIVFYVVDLVLVFLITAVYYCIMNYITSLLVEVYGVSQDVSIYVTIIAPIAIAFGPMIMIKRCDKHKDFVRQGLLFGLFLVPISLLLVFFYQINVILALVLSVLYVLVANGIKSVILSVMAFKLRSVMNVGAYSAISNAVASISAGVTPTVMGLIIDKFGWQSYYLATAILVIFVLCAIAIIDVIVRRDYKKAHENKENLRSEN